METRGRCRGTGRELIILGLLLGRERTRYELNKLLKTSISLVDPHHRDTASLAAALLAREGYE